MTYAGLTTADKPALLDAKARGAEWVARDEATTLWGYDSKPHKFVYGRKYATWTIDNNDFLLGAIDLDDDLLPFIQWSDTEPVNIDLALAQIAEMERDFSAVFPDEGHVTNQKPITVFDAIRGMSVEEMARYLSKNTLTCPPNGSTRKTPCNPHGCEECWTEYLNIPYTKEDGE